MARDAQLALQLREKMSWGGARAGAGRKRKKKRAVVSREARPELNGRKHSVHVTLRVRAEIKSLRFLHHRIRRALLAGGRKTDFRVIHFSIPGNHMHIICKADNKVSLSRGMQGLAVRIARAVNEAMGRKYGKVFSDRYHARVLKSPTETKRALEYVFHNYRMHMREAGRPVREDFIDPCSSAIYFVGDEHNPLPAPCTWMLAVGWREKCGPIRIGGFEV